MSREWTSNASFPPGYGLVLSDVRHHNYLFARDVRVIGLRVATSPVDAAIGKSTPLQLGSAALVRMDSAADDAAPSKPNDPPLELDGPDLPLIRGYPRPRSVVAYFRTPGYALKDGAQSLAIVQRYTVTAYSKDPPHEPFSLVNGARLYPLITFSIPEANARGKGIAYLRVDYRLELSLERLDASSKNPQIRDQAGLFRDSDQILDQSPGLAALFLGTGKLPQPPIEYLFDNIEKPLAYEVVGQGIDWGAKSDWDNIHLWSAMDGLPPTPGANHAAHLHWRWGVAGGLPDVAKAIATASFSSSDAVKLAAASRFRGPGGLGTPLIDASLPQQRLRVAVTLASRGPSASAPNAKTFKDLIVTRAAQPIAKDGDALIVWISVEVKRDLAKARDAWSGTLLPHGMFFTHDHDVVSKIAANVTAASSIAGKNAQQVATAGALIDSLHEPANRNVGGGARAGDWERPNKLRP